MVDPISAMALASSAFQALKKGVTIGKELHSMSNEISTWMSAVSDIDRAHHEAKNPPLFRKLFYGKTVEQEAVELFTQKKQLQNQRDELRKLISSMCGPSAWQELLRMEADIRKQRKETLYAQREARRHFIEAISITFLVLFISCFLLGLTWLFVNRGSL